MSRHRKQQLLKIVQKRDQLVKSHVGKHVCKFSRDLDPKVGARTLGKLIDGLWCSKRIKKDKTKKFKIWDYGSYSLSKKTNMKVVKYFIKHDHYSLKSHSYILYKNLHFTSGNLKFLLHDIIIAKPLCSIFSFLFFLSLFWHTAVCEALNSFKWPCRTLCVTGLFEDQGWQGLWIKNEAGATYKLSSMKKKKYLNGKIVRL